MVEASCHCGLITLEIDTAPTEVTECNCSICRRYGALWAYYSPAEVTIKSPGAITDTYMWDDRSLAFHRCPTCGCVTHWWPEPSCGLDRMGINARLLPLEILARAKVRHLDGAVTERYID